MSIRGRTFGYRYALVRKIPVSKTHYIKAWYMAPTGVLLFLTAAALLTGRLAGAVVWAIATALAAKPQPYQRVPLTKDVFTDD